MLHQVVSLGSEIVLVPALAATGKSQLVLRFNTARKIAHLSR